MRGRVSQVRILPGPPFLLTFTHAAEAAAAALTLKKEMLTESKKMVGIVNPPMGKERAVARFRRPFNSRSRWAIATTELYTCTH